MENRRKWKKIDTWIYFILLLYWKIVLMHGFKITFSLKNLYLQQDPLLGMNPRKMYHTKLVCTYSLATPFIIGKTWEKPRWPPTDE